jgi:uncharacterized protein with GYD domain
MINQVSKQPQLAPLGGILGGIPIDRELVAELDESATSRYWHDPGANRAGFPTCAQVARCSFAISSELGNKEDAMPHFMIRWQFTSTSAKALVGKPHDRTGAAKALVEGFGGKLNSYYLALGEYDGVAICEFPDNKAAVACSMSATATGGFSRFETTTLLTAQEAEAAMKQANQTKTEYKPPNT